MVSIDVTEALVELGSLLSKSERRFGAAPEPRSKLIDRALAELKRAICPNKEIILERLASSNTAMGAVILDGFVTWLTAIPVAAATLAREVARVGVERFCNDPQILLRDS